MGLQMLPRKAARFGSAPPADGQREKGASRTCYLALRLWLTHESVLGLR